MTDSDGIILSVPYEQVADKGGFGIAFHHSRRETGGFFVARKQKGGKTMLKITSKQADKVHRLVKDCCANCDKDGNCILLDDGEAHRCVQLISIYGIYCNYFKNAVLPSDQELFEQIQKQNKLK